MTIKWPAIHVSCVMLCRLLDILEVIAPYKHFNKLREFVSLKLPHGFPVKVGTYIGSWLREGEVHNHK